MSNPSKAKKGDKPFSRSEDVNRFLGQLFFFLMFFAILLTIASFGLIAEA